MNADNEYCIKNLKTAREELLSIKLDTLRKKDISDWHVKYYKSFQNAQVIAPNNSLGADIFLRLNTYEEDTPLEVLKSLRDWLIDRIDQAILIIDKSETIRPILDELILKVSNQKLSTLLNEFNRCKDSNYNLAMIGFRTILALIIKERAKIVDPKSYLATEEDIDFKDIEEVIKEDIKIFSEDIKKLLFRYHKNTLKVSCDNVAHKVNFLGSKDDIEDLIKLLDKLLPTITDN